MGAHDDSELAEPETRPAVSGETDLDRMLATLTVRRAPGTWTFLHVPPGATSPLESVARARIVEDEGTTLVVPVEAADDAGEEVGYRGAWLTLAVHSSLDAVGLTAALSTALADAGISANVIAAYHHDHVLVPEAEADRAVAALHALRGDPEVVVRPMSADDDGLRWAALHRASHSFEEEGVGVDDIRTNPSLVRYVEGWGRRGDHGVVGEVAGTAVGAAWVRLHVGAQRESADFVDDDTPELAVAVLPGWEGSGAGTAMLGALLTEVDRHHHGVVLSVREGNPARRLYERLGFLPVGTITNRVGGRSTKMVRAAGGDPPIRTAEPADGERLDELHHESSLVWESTRAALRAHPEVLGVDRGAVAAGRCRVVEIGGRILAFATAGRPADGTVELEDLFVDPAAMRLGLGRALVADAVERAREAGAACLGVTAAADAAGFYESVGFVGGDEVTTRFAPARRYRLELT